ncbi:MAG: hypothetical protein Fur0041_09600 [Bacteroidia bacterium]
MIVMLLQLNSCKKEQQGVPNIYVNLTVYVNEPQNIALTTVGGWKYFTGGYRGLLVFRKSQNEFICYDRACPYLVDEPSSFVEVDTSNNIILEDKSCGSKFLIQDGSTIQSPALIPLKQYRTVYDGTTLRISN